MTARKSHTKKSHKGTTAHPHEDQPEQSVTAESPEAEPEAEAPAAPAKPSEPEQQWGPKGA